MTWSDAARRAAAEARKRKAKGRRYRPANAGTTDTLGGDSPKRFGMTPAQRAIVESHPARPQWEAAKRRGQFG